MLYLLSFDHAMQSLKNTVSKTVDELLEVFTEMKAHLYLYAGTLLLKMVLEKEQQWRAIVDLAALCYLLAYQVKLGKQNTNCNNLMKIVLRKCRQECPKVVMIHIITFRYETTVVSLFYF